ncbi:hypothetical protein EG327_008437 [Venturia inaequalis]|uniref:Uncharacterized protein n=1 Tax=Venturia inaequalis TaxID=5025 RepID=A0A8H3UTP4_VENIN|nr:hypothetical protein EG327_008437 [Venturia inaequalis]
METARSQSTRGSMLDMSLLGYSKGDPTRAASRVSFAGKLDTSRLPDPGPLKSCAPPRTVYSWMYDKPISLPPAKRASKCMSSSCYALEERPSSGLGRDALLNRQQRYKSWADQIEREEENIKKNNEDRVLTALDEPKMTKAEKRQSASMLKEAERCLKEAQERNMGQDPEEVAITGRQQRYMYEGMAKRFAEVIELMDANSLMLKEPVFRDYVYLLCDSDDLIVQEMKNIEKTKKDIWAKKYALHHLLYELHQYEQNGGRDDESEYEEPAPTPRRKPLGVSIKEISANLQVDSESDEE